MQAKELVSQHQIEIDQIMDSDLGQLDLILIQHVRDRNTGKVVWKEIRAIEAHMRGWLDGDSRKIKYLVARDETGKVYGCMAYSTPDKDMVKHFQIGDDLTVELLNAFVSNEARGVGVGKKLFEAICEAAKSDGKKLLVINSGPRYKKSWGFYDKMCGENTGMIVGKYGRGGDAMTWRKEL